MGNLNWGWIGWSLFWVYVMAAWSLDGSFWAILRHGNFALLSWGNEEARSFSGRLVDDSAILSIFHFFHIGCSLPFFILIHDFPEWNIQSAKKYVAVAHVAYSWYIISAGQMLEIKLRWRKPVSFSRLSVLSFSQENLVNVMHKLFPQSSIPTSQALPWLTCVSSWNALATLRLPPSTTFLILWATRWSRCTHPSRKLAWIGFGDRLECASALGQPYWTSSRNALGNCAYFSIGFWRPFARH